MSSDSEIASASATATATATHPNRIEQQQAMETETHLQASQNDIPQQESKKLDARNDIPQQESKKLNFSNLTFRIWPPAQRTRDAVIARLIETLTTPSVLSKRYGAMPTDEADFTARFIENDAFSVADAAASAEDDGIEVLQVYSKEISKRMLEAVKSRSSAAASGISSGVDDTTSPAQPAGGPNEESVSSSVETEG
ncbi:MFP1 attachment factor 1 isoform X2 [Citrus clementina]|uniref:MFP1 attachment factor 1 isoform X2 n=1 Tax=Citrus clementina TaxID=85681 RepID=UPI000CECF3CD|nr:MFP1 attachment factor 1 isoform X2 [Citrus x clementina]